MADEVRYGIIGSGMMGVGPEYRGPAAVGLEGGPWSVAIGIAALRSIDEGRPVTMAEVLMDAFDRRLSNSATLTEG
jgi:hypothetical protein